MATPVYSGGGYRRRGWGGHRRVHAPSSTDNGWLDRVTAWFDGVTPQYAGAGQRASATDGRGTPAYLAPPPTTTTEDATTTPQAAPSVIVAPCT